MAQKKKYISVHRILTKVNPLTYVEPGTALMLEADEGEKMEAMGAVRLAEPEKSATTKKTPKKSTSAAEETAPAEGDDLV